jgi:adenosylmethionine-8-amino-7-oxononanoate aminotransferase
MLPHCTRLEPIPYRSGPEDPDWDSLSGDEWARLENQLAPLADSLAAIVVEPVVQGAGSMKIYSPDFLRKLRAWTSENGVYLIADEIMTGLGRTGRVLACDHAGIKPDFAVLSKALTGGWLPMAVTLTTDEIYELFYDDYWSGKAFMHSNTYAGNALATAAAVAALSAYESEGTIGRVARDGKTLRTRMQAVADQTGALRNVRGVGFVVAADLVNPASGEAFDKTNRTGWHVYHEAIRHGAWLRPLGDTIYWLPPLNTPDSVLDQLADITAQAVLSGVR